MAQNLPKLIFKKLQHTNSRNSVQLKQNFLKCIQAHQNQTTKTQNKQRIFMTPDLCYLERNNNKSGNQLLKGNSIIQKTAKSTYLQCKKEITAKLEFYAQQNNLSKFILKQIHFQRKILREFITGRLDIQEIPKGVFKVE